MEELYCNDSQKLMAHLNVLCTHFFFAEFTLRPPGKAAILAVLLEIFQHTLPGAAILKVEATVHLYL